MKSMIIGLLCSLFLLSDIAWSQEKGAWEETANALIKEMKELRAENEKLRTDHERVVKELRAENEKLKLQILDMLEVELRKRVPEMHKEVVGLLQQLLPKPNRRLFGTATHNSASGYDPSPAQNGIDGNINTVASPYSGNWWAVDLQTPAQINHITIWMYYQPGHSYSLIIQDENQKEAYRTDLVQEAQRIHGVKSTISNGQTGFQCLDIPIPNVTGKVVRLESENYNLQLREVFIFGTPVK